MGTQSTILDQFGQPIKLSDLAEPQTSQISSLQNNYLTPMLAGITPARLAQALQQADNGDLLVQHRIFADMEERDTHMLAEMTKRKNSLVGLDWDIIPPRNATSAETSIGEWMKEVLQDAIDPLEDLIICLMSGIGHGFGCAELAWEKNGSELLPTYQPRPHEWFMLDRETRTHLRLKDMSGQGQELRPFGWVWHVPGKPMTGYGARMGLYRSLVWPFIYKAYALGDFAEFLETYGLPIISGKYYAGASADEKASLMRAVTQLGHNARAIMPEGMALEIQKITTSGDGSTHLSMIEWAEKAVSKAILGGTLTSQADGKTSTHALGNVHNEVRHDILKADARQIAATITRDLIYPLIALNKGGIDSMRRCPRLEFDLGEKEDISVYAEALPKLAPLLNIPAEWVRSKLSIPAPEGDEEVLGSGQSNAVSPVKPTTTTVAALSADIRKLPDSDPTSTETDALSSTAAASTDNLIAQVLEMVDVAPSMAALSASLTDAYGGLDTGDLQDVMAAAFALATLKGLSDVQDGN